MRLYEQAQALYDYFISTWMEGIYHPRVWNFYDQDDHTTSNAGESTNWRFTVKTGSAHLNVYTLRAKTTTKTTTTTTTTTTITTATTTTTKQPQNNWVVTSS